VALDENQFGPRGDFHQRIDGEILEIHGRFLANRVGEMLSQNRK
jgi:hypothetical protein